ncbi:efflux transporter outer membrane subunit [Geminisphaera colitermitum]|uniref:efflux transporter outer membrane subunit n=1 Tax=Geminisphaera colitermitum TaxID=1148786 RepID=UPI0003178E23|nr:efflux transporter outer membrane subunit [Geminisphaera colitermitum]
MRHTNTLSATLAALLLTGCAVGPDYQPPVIKSPPAFRTADDSTDGSTLTGTGQPELTAPPAKPADFGAAPWWDVYTDPALASLIQEALASNYDIAIAATRVEQARQAVATARSGYYPSVNYSGAASRGRNQFSGNPSPTLGTTGDDATVVVGASWELDLWGRVRRMDESARARYLATEEARNAVITTLIADVAQAWFELIELDAELTIAKDTRDSFQRSYTLFNERLKGGIASTIETARAEAAVAQTAAAIPEIERSIILKENQINLLLGRAPGPITRQATLDTLVAPTPLPAGLPADLLARRPDLRRSEQLLRSANADIGVAIADYYPRISLTGALGRISPDLSDFTHGTGNLWSILGGLTGPIFQGGRIKASVAAARARWDQARLEHEQSVLNALNEVSEALVSREKIVTTRAEQERRAAALQQAVKISLDRYDAGRASYYEVLEAQQQLFPAQTDVARARRDQHLALVRLYRSLGGGWSAP